MKQILLALLAILFYQKSIAQAGAVTLKVEGIQVEKGGQLSAGIFLRENFPRVGKQTYQHIRRVVAPEEEIQFENIPPGNYAVAVYQDIDGNQDLKTNFMGFPAEPIGFSNDARIKLGPPAFSDAAFSVTADQKITLNIQLR